MAKKKEVVITCNATNVKAVIEGLERGMAALAKEEEKLLNTIKQRGYAENDEKKRLKELEKAMDAMRTNVQKNKDEQKKLAEVMKDLSGAKLKDLKKALQEGKAALNNMSERDPKRKQLVDDLKRIEAQINKNTGATNKMTGAQKGFSSAIASTAKNLATYMIGFAGFNKVKSLVEDVFRSNLKLSDSLANIRKVSGLSSEAINELYRNISKIDSRNTIETLNQLAYTGAKLGIGQNYGVEGLTGFVKAAEQVQMALGEDMGEKALPDLSKMVEVMGLIPKYGVEQSMQKAASAIFQLGATSTATGTNIVEFSKRLYGLANVSRISTQDLLALGSASDAMGLMPEVSATAFNKLFTSIQRQHNLIEQSLGMTKGTIKQYYDEGKTMDAIVEIFERMNQKGNLNLLGSIFKDLGSDGARLVNVMATMADRADILRKHLQTSRDAFKEGEAVIGEYMIQNQTAAALVERASNLWAKAFVNPEGVDMVKEMAQAWYDLSKQMTQSEALMGSLHTSIGMIANAISILIKLFPVLIRFGIIFATTFGFKGLIAGIGGLVTAFRTLYTDIALATGAMGKFNVMMKSNAILFAISSLITAITLFNDYSKAAEEAAKREAERQAKLKAAFEESKEAVQNVVKPLERYKRILDEGNLSEKQKAEVIKELNNKYQEYLDYLGIEIKSAQDLAKAYAKVVEIMQVKKAVEERDSYLQQKNGDNRMSRIEAQTRAESEARSLGVEGINKEYLEGTQNVRRNGHIVRRGSDAVVLDILRKRYGNDIGMSASGQVYRIETINKNAPVSANNQRITNIDVDISGLRDAVASYVKNYRTETDTKKEVYDMFDSEFTWTDKNGKKRKLSEFNMDEYNDTVQKAVYKRKGSLENEKPDKAAIAAAKKAAQDRKKALKLEMDEAQKASTGIISKLEEYYRLQEAAINDARADGQLTEEQAKEMVRALSIVKNESLATARRAVTTGETKDWDELKTKVLPAVMSDTSEVSRNLLETIQKVAVDKLHADLEKFNGSSDVLGLDSRAFFDQMNAKAAGNTREAARLRAAITNEVEKALKQYHFVELAQDKMRKDLETMGFMTETYEQWAKRMQEGIKEKPDTQLPNGGTISDKDAYNKMGQKFVVQRDIAYRINIENEKEAMEWLQQFSKDAEGNMEDWTYAFPELQRWLDLIKTRDESLRKDDIVGARQAEKAIEESMPAIQQFYGNLMQYEGAYYDALKKRDDLQNKRLDSWWEHSDQKKENDRKLRDIQIYDFQYNTMHEGQGMGYMMGLTNDVSQDPEVLHEQAVLEAKIAIWKKAKEEREANQISEEVYQERLKAMQDQTMAYTQKVMDNINKRISRIQAFVKPVETAANTIGKKLGDMIFNMQSEESTWEQIWKNMALAMAESLLTMVGQYAQYQIQKSAINKSEVLDEAGKAQAITMLNISSGAAKTIGTLGWWGIALIPVITGLLMGLLTSALSTVNSSESGKSTSTPRTKLVSGMLTYDKGNVERFAGRRLLYDDGTTQVYGRRRYLGEDGKVYTATEEPAPKDGLVTHPIATTVQGQPAVVAERGPEIVIGRETTKAIMMNEPQLIKYLADYGKTGGFAGGYPAARGLAAFDSGNINGQWSMVNGQSSMVNGQSSMVNGQLSPDDARALVAAIGTFNQTVQQMQQKGIPCYINKYGRGGLIDEVKSGMKFMSKYEG